MDIYFKKEPEITTNMSDWILTFRTQVRRYFRHTIYIRRFTRRENLSVDKTTNAMAVTYIKIILQNKLKYLIYIKYLIIVI